MQNESPFFDDHRTMRSPVEGTISKEEEIDPRRELFELRFAQLCQPSVCLFLTQAELGQFVSHDLFTEKRVDLLKRDRGAGRFDGFHGCRPQGGANGERRDNR